MLGALSKKILFINQARCKLGNMSKITSNDIQHIAELAKIQVSSKEGEALSRKLSDILSLVEQMQAVETDTIEPLAHSIYQNQKLRPDLAHDDSSRDQYQALSPETQDGFYLVPKVIE